MQVFEYHDNDGEVRGAVVGSYMRTHEDNVCILDGTNRIVAIFTLQPGEWVAEKLPVPAEGLLV